MSVDAKGPVHSAILGPIGPLKQKLPLKKEANLMLIVAAMGVVFGDIGTSPLYALKQCFNPDHGIALSANAIFGVVSLIFWAFTLVVSIKYVLIVMRANNHGEGGILALLALALSRVRRGSFQAKSIIVTGILGACMFYGDAIITPSISVLAAVEGLEVLSPHLNEFIIPITLIILAALFIIQKNGTASVGTLFGFIMILWFGVIALMGMQQIIWYPEILAALNPWHTITFFQEHGFIAFIVLGSVFLVLTGAEALYADMGHFGARPIKAAWFFAVMPCLLLNYFGQGALLLREPASISNPFFLMVPPDLILPLITLATLATIIASQAVISGVFSVTSQAILLGFLPRMKVNHTSEKTIGQIYMPLVNWLLLSLVIIVVVSFKRSDNLAAAYGIAVTTTMFLTTCLTAVVMRKVWHWNALFIAAIISVLLFVDSVFLAANFLKIVQGGWFPLLLGLLFFVVLITWYEGKQILLVHTLKKATRLDTYIHKLQQENHSLVKGIAVFLTNHIDYVPDSFIYNLKHNHVLHEQIFFLHVTILDIPYVDEEDRISVKEIGDKVYVIRALYGFNEKPDVPELMHLVKAENSLDFDVDNISYFLSRNSVSPTMIPGMTLWREYLFAWMYQNAARQEDFFKLPADHLVVLGGKIEI